jgi:hypothetical protein
VTDLSVPIDAVVGAVLALIHRWNLPQFLCNWQTLIGGVLALVAGYITVRAIRKQTATAVRLEQDRVANEVDALRKSLAVELRQQIPSALDVCNRLRERATSKSALPIPAWIVESLSRTPAPIIYSANAGKIGLLGGDAMNVVIIYTHLEIAREAATRLTTTSRTPDNFSRSTIHDIAEAFLKACEYARGMLPKLRTGDASHDATDEELVQKINAALAIPRPSTENPLPPWPGSPSA